MIEASYKSGRPIPDPITNAPDLCPFLKPYFNAFRELKTTRVWSGMGDPMEIPWMALDAYARRYTFFEMDFNLFVTYIRGLDTAWLKWHAEAREAEDKKRKATSKLSSKRK